MRLGVALLLAAFFVIPTVPGAAAQGGPSAGQVQVLEDDRGDVQAVSPAVPAQTLPDAHFKGEDLVGLIVSEDEGGFAFHVAVAGLDQAPEAPGADDGVYYVTFTHHDQAYRLVMYRALGDQSYYWGLLLKYDPEGRLNYQRELTVSGDAASGTVSTSVARDDLLDREGAAPFPGRTLSDFWVASHLRSSQGDFINIDGTDPGREYDAADRMPDAGNGTTPFAVKMGLAQAGHAVLWSPDPIRASNGEQATFVFNVTGQNTGDREEIFDVAAVGRLPEGWTVTLPASAVRIGAGQSVPLPVLVSTPFAHLHGALKKFRLEMQSESDPASVGRVDLGIRYFAVPQPAGHHNVLTFHSQTFGSQNPLFEVFELGFTGNSGLPYMNTVSDDTADAKAKITGYFWGYGCFQGCAPPEAQWKWFVGLQPSLEMGLDFDMSGTLDVQVPIETRIPFPMATVSGALYHDAYDEAAGKWKATVLASLAPSEPTNLDANTPHLFSWQVSPAAAADLVPYAKRAYLTLMLNLTTPKAGLFTGAEAPMLDPGGVMKLPLFEYRDPVSQALQSVGAVRLEPLGARERAVNPGKAAVFAVRLVNDLDRDQDFDLNVTGIHAGWSRLLGPDAVHVAARSAAEIRLGVRVPADAADRDAADLVLSAEDPANPSVRSLIRLLAVVDVGHPQPDDAAQMDAYQPETAHDSPALPAMLAVLALAAGARLAGSRRASGPPRMGLK